jgi:hypothetical protein
VKSYRGCDVTHHMKITPKSMMSHHLQICDAVHAVAPHNDTGPTALGGSRPPLRGPFLCDARPCGGDRARHVGPWGSAPGVSERSVGAPRRPAPSDFVRPFAPLTVVLLGLVRAFRGAVRTKLHCYDCLACAPEPENNPSNPEIQWFHGQKRPPHAPA